MSLYCSSHFVWKISILRGIKGIISTESKINKVFFFFFSLFLNFLAELRKAYRQTTQPDMTPLAGVKCDISLPSAETNLGRTGGIVNNTLSKLRNVFNCCFKLADDCFRTSLRSLPGTWSAEFLKRHWAQQAVIYHMPNKDKKRPGRCHNSQGVVRVHLSTSKNTMS